MSYVTTKASTASLTKQEVARRVSLVLEIMLSVLEAWIQSLNTYTPDIAYEIKWSLSRKEISYLLYFCPRIEVIRFILNLYLIKEDTFVILNDIFYFLSSILD